MRRPPLQRGLIMEKLKQYDSNIKLIAVAGAGRLFGCFFIKVYNGGLVYNCDHVFTLQDYLDHKEAVIDELKYKKAVFQDCEKDIARFKGRRVFYNDEKKRGRMNRSLGKWKIQASQRFIGF